jgi:hypothetical protein
METPQIDREYSTGPAPAQHRTNPAGHLMFLAFELAAGAPAEDMGPASSGPSPGDGAVPLAIGRHETDPGLELVGYQSSPSSTCTKPTGRRSRLTT